MLPSDRTLPAVANPPVAALAGRKRRKRLRGGRVFALPGAAQWQVGLLVTLAYVVATIAMTWPMAAQLGSHTSFRRDALLQVWVGRWVQHVLVTDPLHLYDANIFYPLDNTLAYTDANVPGALAMAVPYLLTGNAILAFNLTVLATFVLAAGGVYALVTHLTGNRAAAFLAGLAYAFLPYRYGHIHHLNLLGDAWTPWVILALAALVARPTWPAAVRLGLLIAIEAVTSFYLAFQLVLVLGIGLAVAFVAVPAIRTPRFLARLAGAAALALIIVVPLALPYVQAHDEQGLERDLDQTIQRGASPEAYVINVDGQNRVWGWLPSARNLENQNFIGGVAGIGAVVGVALGWRRRRALVVGLLGLGAAAFVLALGPIWRPEAGGTTPLPYLFLFDHVPGFKGMRAPGRFGVLVNLVVVLLAGCGAAWAWELGRGRFTPARALVAGRALTALLAVAILAELISVPVTMRPFDASATTAAPYEWLAAQPDQGPVMEFPVSNQPWATLNAMYWSTLSWKPLVVATSGFNPQPHQEVLHAFDNALRRADGKAGPVVSHLNPDNVGFLQDLGVRWVVIHRDGYDPADWPDILARATATGQLDAATSAGDTFVFRLRPAAPEPPPTVRLEAPPTATATGTPWSPRLVIANPRARWSLIYVKAPVWLSLTWRDAAGKVVQQEELVWPVSTVAPPGETACDVGGCHLAGQAAVPPLDHALPPATPGRYQLELRARGGLLATATVPVEVVAGR